MSIRFECEQCGSVLKIKDDLAGKPGKCPKCKTAFTVPVLIGKSESSGETVDAESPEDAEPMLASTKLESAEEDFDLDAFLLDDDDAKPKTSKTRSSKPQHTGEQSDDDDGGRVGKANEDEDSEAFSIRRGPDSTEKRLKATSFTAQEDEDDVEPSTPTRRPPGTNPNAPASNIASDLLSMSAKKGKRVSWTEIAREKNQEEQFDWQGMSREVLKKAIPIVIVGVVLCWGVFKVVDSAMAPKTFVPPLGQVTGTVTINAKPVVGADVWFYPEKNTIQLDGKGFKVTASQGMTDAAGHYELTYIGDLKGAVIGTCRVQIVAAGRRDVAPQYLGDKSTATQTVKKGKQVIDLEVSR